MTTLTDHATENVLRTNIGLAHLISKRMAEYCTQGDKDDLYQEALIALWQDTQRYPHKYEGDNPGGLVGAVMQQRCNALLSTTKHESRQHLFGHISIGVAPMRDTLMRRDKMEWLDRPLNISGADDLTVGSMIPDANTGPDDLDWAMIEDVQKAVSELPPRQRYAVETELQGLTPKQAGDAVGRSNTSIWAARKKAHKALSEKLAHLAA